MKENAEVIKALAEAWAQMPSIEKDKTNPHFKSEYASIDVMIKKIKPILSSNGLVLSQPSEHCENAAAVRTVIYHGASGQSLDMGVTSVPVDKKNAQGYGSALTYARRYGLCCAFALATGEDDDGNAAAGAKPDSIMSVKGRITKQITKLGFTAQADVANIAGLARREVDGSDNVGGWLAVETFLGTLDSNSVMDFLNRK